MSLSEQEKMQIAEVVHNVIDYKFTQLRKEIIEGFIEALDWHNENFAKIMQSRNEKTLAFIEKRKREVIEIHSAEYREAAMQRQAEREEAKKVSSRLGFTATISPLPDEKSEEVQ